MPPKAVESKNMRFPKQYVKPGRGVAGYTGNVETYDPGRPAKAKLVSNAAGDIAPAPAPEKLDHRNLTRAQLESIGEQRGLTQEQMDAAITKAELVELLEAAGP